MTRNFKINKLGIVSPCLHLLDRWTRHKRVYVGYVGPRLRNTQTN